MFWLVPHGAPSRLVQVCYYLQSVAFFCAPCIMEYTAAGTAPDFNRIPFSPVVGECPECVGMSVLRLRIQDRQAKVLRGDKIFHDDKQHS